MAASSPNFGLVHQCGDLIAGSGMLVDLPALAKFLQPGQCSCRLARGQITPDFGERLIGVAVAQAVEGFGVSAKTIGYFQILPAGGGVSHIETVAGTLDDLAGDL